MHSHALAHMCLPMRQLRLLLSTLSTCILEYVEYICDCLQVLHPMPSMRIGRLRQLAQAISSMNTKHMDEQQAMMQAHSMDHAWHSFLAFATCLSAVLHTM